MPNAPHARRVGARIARARSRPSPLPSALLAALLLCPVACASSPRPEVFRAMRAAWGEDKPMAVRISANDWIDGGVDPEEAVAIAKMFAEAGADIIDVSSGQTDPAEKPVYGRMFQTPFSDRIRNEGGLATMTVGNISDFDQVNGILMAGRADLVCLARMHLADPYWTLHAAVEQDEQGVEWPVPYKGGRDLLYRLRERQQEAIRA